MQEYDFDIKYIKGKEKVIEETLTRSDGVHKTDRKLQIAIKILREKVGIFSLHEVTKDQKQLKVRETNKCIKIDNTWIKKIGDQELYVITKSLAYNIFKYWHWHWFILEQEKYG